jgi:hypothetical protein
MIAENISLGILSLPAVLARVGLIGGLIGIIGLGIFTTYSGYVLWQFKMRHPQVSIYLMIKIVRRLTSTDHQLCRHWRSPSRSLGQGDIRCCIRYLYDFLYGIAHSNFHHRLECLDWARHMYHCLGRCRCGRLHSPLHSKDPEKHFVPVHSL